MIPILPLLVSRQWNWTEAWIYAVICILGFIISRIIAARRNPGLLVIRTSLEDRTLQNELAGYDEYARHTRYRLFPGVW